MNIREARAGDVESVARLHAQAFPGFFLTSLGFSFLVELYKGFLSHPAGILLVAEEDQSLLGFAAGTSEPELFFAELRRRRAPWFLWYALPALLRNPMIVLRKLFSAFFYRGDKPAKLDGGSLLSSIGVRPDAGRRSLGTVLLVAFEQAAQSRSSPFVYLTTDQFNNEKANAFYVKNGYQVESQFRNGPRPMLRYSKTLVKDTRHDSPIP